MLCAHPSAAEADSREIGIAAHGDDFPAGRQGERNARSVRWVALDILV